VYNYNYEAMESSMGSTGVSHSVYAQICSPGADVFAVWTRATRLTSSVHMLAVPIPDSIRQLAPPGTAVPTYYFEIPELLRQDLQRTPLKEYVFEVMARFPLNGIPKEGMKGMPADFLTLVAELERARSAASGNDGSPREELA